MSFSAYPEYIDSGVDRLGEVPAGWTVSPLKRFLIRNDGGVWGDDPDGENETIVLRSTEQAVDGRWQIEEPATRTLNPRERDSALLEVGDLVVTKSSGSSLHIGKTSIVDEAIADLGACYSNFMQRLRVSSDCNPRFVWFVMNNPIARGQFDLFSNSTTGLANLNATILGEVRLAFPSGDEQRKIVNFLDRETGKIDAAVAAQERLIALLAEKRAATISHAVTKGLDPDAPRKDSGIEWLGQIPAHWGKMPLRSAGDGDGGLFLDGDWIESKDLADEGIRYLTTGNVGPGFYKEQGSGYISEDTFDRLNCTEVYPGDVLVSRLNAPVGRACRVPDLGERIVTSVDNVIVRPVGSVDPHFLVYLLTCGQYFQHNDTMARGTTMQRVSRTILGNIRIPLPPLEEQRQIAAHLDAECADLDRLSAVAESVIYLLKERRAAIISAAVTGKIDVRGEVDLKEQEAA